MSELVELHVDLWTVIFQLASYSTMKIQLKCVGLIQREHYYYLIKILFVFTMI